MLVTKPFFRNHLLLMVCSINGFGDSYYFPLMLMDIMNNSKVSTSWVRSGRALGLPWFILKEKRLFLLFSPLSPRSLSPACPLFTVSLARPPLPFRYWP